MITEDSIALVRDLSIVDVAGMYVQLKRGDKACCPIHGEKTPSFSINRQKNIFKCFGCGAGGDGIRLVQMIDNLDFMGAVELLAGKFNIPLEYARNYDNEAYQKQREEKKSLRDILNEAHKKYMQLLAHPTAGAKAREYITKQRGYNEDVITYWNLGFAPDEWRTLSAEYAKTGLLPKAVKLGLSKEKDQGNAYDVYRNRIIFPILNENGELLTFAGRTLSEVTDVNPKYINGAQSELYNKSATLFGLYQAIPGIRKTGYAILCEGYTDVISMHTAGAVNTVASCGTSLTKEQCILLKKYTSYVMLIRDGDAAGREAAERDMPLLLEQGFKVDLVLLERDQDPDDMARPFFEQAEKKQPAKPAGWSIKCVTKPATGQWHFIK